MGAACSPWFPRWGAYRDPSVASPEKGKLGGPVVPAVLERVVRHMVCPTCRAPLETVFPSRKGGGRLRFADLMCRSCHARYAIREGVGLFAVPVDAGGDWRPDPSLVAYPADDGHWQTYLASLPAGVPEAYERILERLEADLLSVDGLVLDLATCSGHILRRLAARTGGHQLLMGLEPDLSRLFACQAALRRERHYANISLAEVDPGHLPFEDRAASGAMSFFGPSALPHGRAVLREMARVLRPGSLFAFSTLLTQEGTLTLRQAARTGVDELLTEGRLRRALASAGFAVERWEVQASGESWRRNPYDALPLEGDPYQHVLVGTRRRPGVARSQRPPRPSGSRR